MKRFVALGLKWITPALILAELLLLFGGMLNVQTAVGVILGVEALLTLAGGAQIIRAIRRCRQSRAGGLDFWEALTDGFAVFLPPRAARVLALEPQLWACLFLWLFRRRRPDEQSFTYHKQSIVGVFLIAALFSSPVEIVLFELLIPWAWLRWALLIASLYVLIWLLGYYASLVVLPHRLEAEGIRLRYGAFAAGFVPYAAIAEAARERQAIPKKSRGLLVDPGASAAYFGMDGAANVRLRLNTPLPLRGFFTITAPVATIYLAVDEPERFIRQIRQRLEHAAVVSPASAVEQANAS